MENLLIEKNTTAYCLRCKKSVEPKNPTVSVTAKGRKILSGTCPICYTKLSKILKSTD